MNRPLLTLACASVVFCGCDQPSTVSVKLGDAATKAPEPQGPATIILHVPARKALADGDLWLVDDGVTPLGTGVRKPGLALVTHFVDDSEPILYNRIHRLTYHGRAASFGTAFEVEAEDLVEWGLEPPAEAVWLFGPLGSCSATVGAPWVGRPSSDVRVFEVSYALEGCGMEGRWAPLASTSVPMPERVTWLDAQTTVDATHAADEDWSHALAAFAQYPESEAASSFVAHARWVEAQPRPAQALVTAIEGSAEDDDACGVERHQATSGWWRDDGFEPWDVPWIDPADPPLLVGALAWGGETAALVLDDGLDGMVAIVPSEDVELGPQSWDVRTLIAGVWSAADRDASALRVQPSSACE